ncbi:Rrn11p ASCRUDRAFT_69030 [Ascoidea rubescens DSM 1968]|uniref:Uncharacterized protein n=1 Tax=Ascoidea rubescens DSM 1968 TaxID=1344418 RepID=A0A1D2VKT9_9ASCO|nr:hypothetical protein ASCRUDRAFT_69030 [Ascoidea rubescens DSM 1968]ODV62205.1 hypothetical protein ASCRUDRAFT_69030 [Ascoidea rubescens DSM 1968]
MFENPLINVYESSKHNKKRKLEILLKEYVEKLKKQSSSDIKLPEFSQNTSDERELKKRKKSLRKASRKASKRLQETFEEWNINPVTKSLSHTDNEKWKNSSRIKKSKKSDSALGEEVLIRKRKLSDVFEGNEELAWMEEGADKDEDEDEEQNEDEEHELNHEPVEISTINQNSWVYTNFLIRTKGYEVLPYLNPIFTQLDNNNNYNDGSCRNNYEGSKIDNNGVSNEINDQNFNSNFNFSKKHINLLINLLYINIFKKNWKIAYKVFSIIIRLNLSRVILDIDNSKGGKSSKSKNKEKIDLRTLWPLGIELLNGLKEEAIQKQISKLEIDDVNLEQSKTEINKINSNFINEFKLQYYNNNEILNEALEDMIQINNDNKIYKNERYLEWLSNFYGVNASINYFNSERKFRFSPLWRVGSRVYSPLYTLSYIWTLILNINNLNLNNFDIIPAISNKPLLIRKEMRLNENIISNSNRKIKIIKDKLSELLLQPPFNEDLNFMYLKFVINLIEINLLIYELINNELDKKIKKIKIDKKYVEELDSYRDILKLIENNNKYLDDCIEKGLIIDKRIVTKEVRYLLTKIETILIT